MDHQLIVVTGPTASGKTGRSLALAKELNAAIISADSRMVYQGLDIGTGKPTWEYRELDHSPWVNPRLVPTSEVTILRRAQDSSEVKKMTQSQRTLREWRSRHGGTFPKGRHNLGPIYSIQGVDHYLLDLVPPETPFTLADWLHHARQAIREIQRHGQRPIVVGGTGLYLKALIEGYQPPPTDSFVRAQIDQLATKEILAELQKIDPLTAQREAANRRRLIRALEVFQLTGVPFSQSVKQPIPAKIIRIKLPRAELFASIDSRLLERLRAGMIEEVENLLGQGVSSDWLISLGLEYRIITEWLIGGKKEKGKLIARLQREIHAYARRQETFLRTQLFSK